jgi:hypothetical protein
MHDHRKFLTGVQKNTVAKSRHLLYHDVQCHRRSEESHIDCVRKIASYDDRPKNWSLANHWGTARDFFSSASCDYIPVKTPNHADSFRPPATENQTESETVILAPIEALRLSSMWTTTTTATTTTTTATWSWVQNLSPSFHSRRLMVEDWHLDICIFQTEPNCPTSFLRIYPGLNCNQETFVHMYGGMMKRDALRCWRWEKMRHSFPKDVINNTEHNRQHRLFNAVWTFAYGQDMSKRTSCTRSICLKLSTPYSARENWKLTKVLCQLKDNMQKTELWPDTPNKGRNQISSRLSILWEVNWLRTSTEYMQSYKDNMVVFLA